MEGQLVIDRSKHEAFCDALRQRIGATRYTMWFEGAVGIAVSRADAANSDAPSSNPTGDASRPYEARLTIGSAFEQTLLRRQFQADLDAASIATFGAEGRVVFAIRTASGKSTGRASQTTTANPKGVAASATANRDSGSAQSEPTQLAESDAERATTPAAPLASGAITAALSTSAPAAKVSLPAMPVAADPNASLAVAVEPAPAAKATPAPAPSGEPTPPAPNSDATPRRHLPLEGWVVGEGNAPATRISQRIISGAVAPSPILLWGPSGSGKTHLLRSIAEGVRTRNRRRRVLSITAEQFLRGFVEAARGGGFPSFRQKHQGADVLLVDDVQQLIGKTRTLEEFRQTIDAAIESGAQIVLSADRGPTELRELGPEIASRLAGGLSIEIPMPNAATRESLVRRAAERVGLALPESTARTLAHRLLGGGREVQGAIHRMELLHETFDLPLDDRLATRVADDTNRLSTPPVRLDDIQRAVCDVCGVDYKTLRSDKRTKAVTQPRMLAMWLSRKMTGSAWSEIGDYFGRRSHSTVIAAHRRVETLLATGEPTQLVTGELGETIRRIEAALRSA